MKPDLLTLEDIKVIVNTFYDKAKQDPTIGSFFSNDRIDWTEHLPKMYKFWENAVFYTGGYMGNPMELHKFLHQRYSLTQQHFEAWVILFCATVDEYFEGENAENIKQRANSIGTIMTVKLLGTQTMLLPPNTASDSNQQQKNTHTK
ncbi:MAG: group III truncated hemoglobin [Saprospiraceae bacterium]|nr:group III truncated hemoglobin [Saprospiraceae bacterium]MBP7699807.1 group III truncated hemoglobin [Saprospiraceae bacterium]